MKRLFRYVVITVASVFALFALFVFANFAAALIPSHKVSLTKLAGDQPSQSIYIAFGPIHSDIGIPLTPEVRNRFNFLNENGVLFDHPNIRYLLFGWGSKTFYTTAKEFKDIRPIPVLKAVTGDASVMHVTPAGNLAQNPNNLGIVLSRDEYEKLLDKLEASFDLKLPNSGLIKGASYGQGDQFFAHSDRFHIGRTCNVWTANMLGNIGIVTGWWSAMSNSLKFGLNRHSANRILQN